ncbi:hypothetical protein WJX74_000480 [Apatococcus lobatus]|uniref:Uncharacterized protein n=1 Tax=Apatococcus lobatus TaxID=904363 RepID=A0AAW1S9A5_9CHLO
MPDQPPLLTDQEQFELAAGQKLRKAARHSSKRDIRRSQPLTLQKEALAITSLTPSEEHQQQLLLENLQQAEKLPPQSRYARHRKACILKALSLLTTSRAAADQDTLEKLLQELNLS